MVDESFGASWDLLPEDLLLAIVSLAVKAESSRSISSGEWVRTLISVSSVSRRWRTALKNFTLEMKQSAKLNLTESKTVPTKEPANGAVETCKTDIRVNETSFVSLLESSFFVFPQSVLDQEVKVPLGSPENRQRLHCVLKQLNSSRTSLHLSVEGAPICETGKFLLASSRRLLPTSTIFDISVSAKNFSTEGGFLVGRVVSNFWRNVFVVYEAVYSHTSATIRPDSEHAATDREVKTPPISENSPARNVEFVKVATLRFGTNMESDKLRRRWTKCELEPRLKEHPGSESPRSLTTAFPFNPLDFFPEDGRDCPSRISFAGVRSSDSSIPSLECGPEEACTPRRHTLSEVEGLPLTIPHRFTSQPSALAVQLKSVRDSRTSRQRKFREQLAFWRRAKDGSKISTRKQRERGSLLIPRSSTEEEGENRPPSPSLLSSPHSYPLSTRRRSCADAQQPTASNQPIGPCSVRSTESSLECAAVFPRLSLQNKSPEWSPIRNLWCLNFSDRAAFSSVRNFQLVDTCDRTVFPHVFSPAEDLDVLLQCGMANKKGTLFTVDFRAPFSAFLAFAISLASLHTNEGLEP